ncbi:MAG: hypothetical protein WC119_03480 [Synergistaceae bacterium]
MNEKDSKFLAKDNNLETVNIKLVLWEDYKTVDLEIINNLSKNLPIRYRDGIFRIEAVRIINNLTDGDSQEILEIEVAGDFSKDDPDGHNHNGWTDNEIGNYSSKIFSSTITDLEV